MECHSGLEGLMDTRQWTDYLSGLTAVSLQTTRPDTDPAIAKSRQS